MGVKVSYIMTPHSINPLWANPFSPQNSVGTGSQTKSESVSEIERVPRNATWIKKMKIK